MKKYLILALVVFATVSCKDDDSSSTPDLSSTFENISKQIANKVVLPTYKDLYEKAQILNTAVKKFNTTKNKENLDAVKKAWIDARVPWEQSEGFLIGPVDTKGLDPSMDSWPLDVAQLNNVISSNKTLNAEYIATLDDNQRGFHTIEFLVWGTTKEYSYKDIKTREAEYLVACSEKLELDTKALYEGWLSDKGNYIKEVLQPGHSTSAAYSTFRDVVKQFVGGLEGIADEVGSGKISEPFKQNDATKEESRFSHNSKADFSNNITSIRNIYYGGVGATSGKENSISKFISKKNPQLDIDITALIAESKLRISEMGSFLDTFTQALEKKDPSIEKAIEKVTELKNKLTKLKTYIDNVK